MCLLLSTVRIAIALVLFVSLRNESTMITTRKAKAPDRMQALKDEFPLYIIRASLIIGVVSLDEWWRNEQHTLVELFWLWEFLNLFNMNSAFIERVFALFKTAFNDQQHLSKEYRIESTILEAVNSRITNGKSIYITGSKDYATTEDASMPRPFSKAAARSKVLFIVPPFPAGDVAAKVESVNAHVCPAVTDLHPGPEVAAVFATPPWADEPPQEQPSAPSPAPAAAHAPALAPAAAPAPTLAPAAAPAPALAPAAAPAPAPALAPAPAAVSVHVPPPAPATIAVPAPAPAPAGVSVPAPAPAPAPSRGGRRRGGGGLINKGDSVQAKFQGGGRWYGGVVFEVHDGSLYEASHGIEQGSYYHVKFDDGQEDCVVPAGKCRVAEDGA